MSSYLVRGIALPWAFGNSAPKALARGFFCLLIVTFMSPNSRAQGCLPGDLNGDSLVTVSDLVDLLSVFGVNYTATPGVD